MLLFYDIYEQMISDETIANTPYHLKCMLTPEDLFAKSVFVGGACIINGIYVFDVFEIGLMHGGILRDMT